MATLAQICSPETYEPCDWHLDREAAAWEYWDALFRWHLDEVLVPLIRAEYPDVADDRVAAFRRAYLEMYDDVRARPDVYQPITVLKYTSLRTDLLETHGLPDPFLHIKQQEDEAALRLLQEVLAELDAADEPTRRQLLAAGVMAGNIFDLGARATIQSYRDEGTAFRATRDKQPPRPWFVDDVDVWFARWDERPARHAVLFVDNAGSDILLGCLPHVRWMLRQGTRVTLGANTGPTLNDITARELEPLLQRCAPLDATIAGALESGQLEVRATGSRTTLIDLTDLEPAFVEATRDADLIILHGMGRGLESNYHVEFTCDVLRTAVIKDESVAEHLGSGLLDCVFRFVPLRGGDQG
jgi:uncharacterized protein with ATP-grasp and redox domains